MESPQPIGFTFNICYKKPPASKEDVSLFFPMNPVHLLALFQFIKVNAVVLLNFFNILAAHISKAVPGADVITNAVSLLTNVFSANASVISDSIAEKMAQHHASITGAFNSNVAAIQSTLHEITAHNTRAVCNNPTKGRRAEFDLMSNLQTALNIDQPMTFKVSHCAESKNNADLLIQTKGRADIIIECKDYSARNVPSEQVNKFQKDMLITLKHGIMISLSSPITGKDNFHIEIVPGCNRLAAYIALDGTMNMDPIIAAVKSIYALESLIVSSCDEAPDHPALVQIKKELYDIEIFAKDLYLHFQQTKAQLKTTLDHLNMCQVDQIYKRILRLTTPSTQLVVLPSLPLEQDFKYICAQCKDHKGCADIKSYNAHLRNKHGVSVIPRGGIKDEVDE